MNERWAVVQIGGKSRIMKRRHDGALEFFDKSNFLVATAAAKYEFWLKLKDEWKIKQGDFGEEWFYWTGRREYCGFGFFPAPAGHNEACPPGYYNAYEGFMVKPKKGSWKRLRKHIYRNICQRNREYFRWLIAYLAQLIQYPHIKPGTHIVLRGPEGVGKSKLGEWIIRLFGPNALPITSETRLSGRFNAHFETLLFALVEEAIWAGDKKAEGVLKALATANEMDYERKGIDPYHGRNYTRLMFASNEDWVVPAGSGGRRWFVLEVGDEHAKDYDYFAAIDEEMENGGLEAMLYDLLRLDFSSVNLREAPVTPWLVEQCKHSIGREERWWHDVLVEGGFTYDDLGDRQFVELKEDQPTTVARPDVFASARPHFGTDRRKAIESEVGDFLKKLLDGTGFVDGPRTSRNGKRLRTYVFPSLAELRAQWYERKGELIEPTSSPANNHIIEVAEPQSQSGQHGAIDPDAAANDNENVPGTRRRAS